MRKTGGKKRPSETVWADEEFKVLKKRQMTASLAETEAKVKLIEAQTELAKLQAEEISKRLRSNSPPLPLFHVF